MATVYSWQWKRKDMVFIMNKNAISKKSISFAQWGMQKQLANLWEICFAEQPRPTNFFFNNCFQPQNCLLYKVGDQVAAMVHLLPAKIIEKGYLAQARRWPNERSDLGTRAAFYRWQMVCLFRRRYADGYSHLRARKHFGWPLRRYVDWERPD